MVALTTTYRTVDEDPGIAYNWLDRDGSTINCSSATWSMVIYNQSGTVVSTKTSGITGAATLPNVIVTWSAGELAAIGAGRYTYKLTATISSRERSVNPGATHTLIIT